MDCFLVSSQIHRRPTQQQRSSTEKVIKKKKLLRKRKKIIIKVKIVNNLILRCDIKIIHIVELFAISSFRQIKNVINIH